MWDEVYSNPIQVPVGPVTRAGVRKFKKVLNGFDLSNLGAIKFVEAR